MTECNLDFFEDDIDNPTYHDKDFQRWVRSRWEVKSDVIDVYDGGFRSGAIFPDNEVQEMMKDREIMRPGMILLNRHNGKFFTVKNVNNNRKGCKQVKFSDSTPQELASIGIME